MATARFGMTLNEVTTSLPDRNTNEANNFQLIDNLAMMLTKNNVLGDGIYIATDKIRARDGDGLQLQDDGGNGITIPNGGGVTFPATYDDKISLYDDRLGLNSMYGIGLETSCFYFKANTGASYRWYIGANADGGTSDIMELSAAGNLSLVGNLFLLAGQYVASAKLRAISSGGLRLEDDGGNGLSILDGGNVQIDDGKYIATDKIRARDADGLCLQDSAGNGITIQSGGGMAFSGGAGDKISLYSDRLGDPEGYCIGVETSYTYMKSSGGYRWYSGANADGGVSDIMELSSAGVLSLSGLSAIDGDGLDLLDNAGDGIHIVSGGWAGFGAASPVGRVHVEGSDYKDSAIVQLRTSGPYQWNHIINAAGGMFFRYGSIVDGDDLVAISTTGAVGVGTVTPAAKLAVNGGVNVGANSDPGDNNLYVVGDCSALTFTDRTPAFVGDALAAIKAIRDDGKGQIDHATLPEFARRTYRKPILEEVEVQKEIIDEKTGKTTIVTETVTKSDRYEEAPGRDIGAMLSVLTTAAQQLLAENEALKVRVENLEKAQVAKA